MITIVAKGSLQKTSGKNLVFRDRPRKTMEAPRAFKYETFYPMPLKPNIGFN
jgi:hypothetical protein